MWRKLELLEVLQKIEKLLEKVQRTLKKLMWLTLLAMFCVTFLAVILAIMGRIKLQEVVSCFCVTAFFCYVHKCYLSKNWKKREIERFAKRLQVLKHAQKVRYRMYFSESREMIDDFSQEMYGIGKDLKEYGEKLCSSKLFSQEQEETIHQMMKQIDGLLETESPC